ncbi:MAG: NFACT family protein [Abditibacteriota bacterium]|nr:NFACT family protein [Abditibacteriota bacterium]
MIYDSLVFRQALAELRSLILNTQVRKVRQSENCEALLELAGGGAEWRLLFSWDPRFARVHLTSSGIKAAPKAPDFCMILRKYLDGALLEGIEQLGFDRIARFVFADAKGCLYYLYAEIMGRHSNLCLVSADGVILGTAKAVGRSQSAVRQMLIGRRYELPPNTGRIDPLETGPEEFAQAVARCAGEGGDFIKKFTGAFSGFSPLLAREMWRGLEPGDAPEARRRIQALKSLGTGCFLQLDEAGLLEGAYPIVLSSIPEDRQKPEASINEALDTVYRSLVSRALREAVRQTLLNRIDKAAGFNNRLLNSCYETLEQAPQADRYREMGDLLTASLHTVSKGDSAAELTDYYDPDMKTVVIPLDTALSPQENAQRYYRRAKRLRASVSQAAGRIEGIKAALEALEDAGKRAAAAERLSELRALQEELLSRGLLREQAARQEEESAAFEGHKIRRTFSPEGWEILYGETAEANDHLTGRLARPNDIWLHARQITGSHVIIRTTAKTAGSVPGSAILFAARLAAANSRAKHSSMVPVDYTFRKYVRKPKGSPAGFVLYSREKTIDVKQ